MFAVIRMTNEESFVYDAARFADVVPDFKRYLKQIIAKLDYSNFNKVQRRLNIHKQRLSAKEYLIDVTCHDHTMRVICRLELYAENCPEAKHLYDKLPVCLAHKFVDATASLVQLNSMARALH